jgi:hypothetical protein
VRMCSKVCYLEVILPFYLKFIYRMIQIVKPRGYLDDISRYL